jgi:HEAT repeat protein
VSGGSGADAARLDQVKALVAQGHPAIPRLVEMLDEPSWVVRREVVASLGMFGDAATPALTACLERQRSSEARIAATVDALVGSSGASADVALMALAQHAEAPVLTDIAQILGRRRSSVANDTLRALTLHADDNVAVSAIEALGRLGGRAAVDALLACVQSNNFYRTFPAIDVLGRSGDPRAVAPLTELLHDSRYILEAARALGRSADRRAVAPLTRLLASPADSNVRVACLALMELLDRQRQLYGSSSSIEAELLRVTSEAMARRVAQSAAGADKREKVAACQLLGELHAEAATPLLLTLLEQEAEVAEAAAQALAKISEASDSALSAALGAGSSKRRLALLPVVRSLANVDAIVACLSDASPEVRSAACEAASRIGAVGAVPALFTLLSDEQQRVVHAAVSAVQALGTDGTEALALEAARSTQPGTRRAGLRVLAYFGFPSALPLFAAAVDEEDARTIETALQGLALLDLPEAQQHLLDAASASGSSTRAAAMRAMAQVSNVAWARTPLLRGLQDADPWVRYYACQALSKLGIEGIDAELRALLADVAGQVRVAAVEALSHSRSPSASEALLDLIGNEDVDVRRAALLGLGLRREPSSLPVLANMAHASDPSTRLLALSALANIAGEGVVPLLQAAARADRAEAVRVAALNLLAERPGREAADALVGLLDAAGDHELLATALAADQPGRLEALLFALERADDNRAAWLVSCLSRSRAKGAAHALYRVLSSTNPAARRAAVSTLAALGTQEARSAIEELSLQDPDPEVRTTCLLCLAP